MLLFVVIDFFILNLTNIFRNHYTNNKSENISNLVDIEEKQRVVNKTEKNKNSSNKEIMKKVKTNSSKDKSKNKENEINNKESVWQIRIPSIGLIAPISEGTSQDVMYEYVGHFEETSKWKGNIGLAAHNRGYPINYFARLKELKKNDKIIYKTKNGTKEYRVNLIKIIQETDWSYLSKSKEDKITLITCVENKPTKRLCIQGSLIKKQ